MLADSAKNDDAKYAIEKIAADYGLDLESIVENHMEEDSIDGLNFLLVLSYDQR